jgi:Zn finger protein HypA/HybF involved in hydrogenase expression
MVRHTCSIICTLLARYVLECWRCDAPVNHRAEQHATMPDRLRLYCEGCGHENGGVLIEEIRVTLR